MRKLGVVVSTRGKTKSGRIPWPPAVGQRFYVGPVGGINAYSATVIAYLADEDVAVTKRWFKHKQRWHYEVKDRIWWEMFSETLLRAGAMPKARGVKSLERKASR